MRTGEVGNEIILYSFAGGRWISDLNDFVL